MPQPVTNTTAANNIQSDPARLGVIGSGWIGSFHAETIALRLPGAVLEAVADPRPDAADQLAARLGVDKSYREAADLIEDPSVEGVVISSPATTHTDLVVAAAQAGKAIFVEKPMALTLEDADRAIDAAETAGVPLQVGFNRRFATDFAAANDVVRRGDVGAPQLLRSLTRDPGLADPGSVRPWTIFLETLIHDFDTLNWLNAGARARQVYAVADALVAPEFKESGLLDTAMVTIRYDNGAIACAEANFSAAYGYDIRGEVFGSRGMVSAGDVRTTSMRRYTAAGQTAQTTRLNTDLFHQAYTDELAAFVQTIRGENPAVPRGADAKAALAIALACVESVTGDRPVALNPRRNG